MYEVYLVLVICCLILIEVALVRRRARKELQRTLEGLEGTLPPGTMGYPIVGETLEFAKKKIGFFKERHLQYGSIFKTHLFGKPVIRVFGADNLRKIIQNENKLVRISYPRSVKKLLGENSMTQAFGEDHKAQKLRLMKYLCPEFLQRHIPMFAETIRNKFRQWSELPSVDLYLECRKLFIDLAAKYLVRLDIKEGDVEEIRQQHEIFSTNLFVLPIYCPGFGYYKAFQAKQRLREIFVRVLNNSKSGSDGICSVLDDYQRGGAEQLSVDRDCEFLDALIELLFFGAETISSAGFCILYMLSKNEKAYQRLCQHIYEGGLRGELDDVLCSRDLKEVTYADAVIKETMRVLPPIGGAYRQVMQTFELEGFTIPQGWSIAFGIRDTHHNDGTVDDVLEFNPDRWTSRGTVDRFSYLPFGGGVRICPGRMYAKTVLRVFTVELAKQFHPELLEDSGLALWPTPKPEGKVKARIVRKPTPHPDSKL